MSNKNNKSSMTERFMDRIKQRFSDEQHPLNAARFEGVSKAQPKPRL